MRKFFDFIWPTIGKPSANFIKDQDDVDKKDTVAIRSIDWSKDNEVALEEARALALAEKERRVSAETKASIYLAAIAAVVPIGLPLCAAFYAEKFPSQAFWLQIATLSLFLASVAYFVGASWWSFRTFKIAVHHRVDASDYSKIWSDENRKSLLVAELLISTRLNRRMVNWKTTCVRQAHGFLLRALLSTVALLLVVVAWKPISMMSSWAASVICW